jgi:hypothetical protein
MYDSDFLSFPVVANSFFRREKPPLDTPAEAEEKRHV